MDTDKRIVLTVAETAERLGMSRQAVYDAIARGDLPVVKIGALLKIPVKRFEQMLEGDDKNGKAG